MIPRACVWRVLSLALALVFGLFVSPSSGFAGTSSATVNWSGGHCTVCGSSYACSNGYGGWNGGTKTFSDPVPAGNVVTDVSVSINGALNCGGSLSTTVSLNSNTVGTTTVSGNCSCGGCQSANFTSSSYETGFPGYVYGGTNSLNVSLGGTICLSNAVVTLTWVSSFTGPTADAGGPYTGNEGSSVSMNGSSSSGGTYSISTYEWDCNNDSTYEISSTSATDSSCTWNDEGSYTLGLRVTDTSGATATDTSPATISNVAPSGTTITGPATGDEGVALSYTVTATDPGSLDTLTYSWDWGDSTAAGSGDAMSHTYMDAGTYTITVTTTDPAGATDTGTLTVVISETAPYLLSVSVPSTGSEGVALAFSASAADAGADPVTYSWNWGDSTPNSVGAAATHTYADDAVYTVTLTLTDDDAATASFTYSVAVANVAPVITSTTVPSTGNEGVALTFSATATDVAADTISYSWNFGDVTAAVTGASVTHSYSAEGTYTVTLTVTDEDTGSNVSASTIVISNAPPVISSASMPNGNEGQTIPFSVTVTDAGGDPLTYSWNFGDSTASTAASPSHAYADQGTYTVTVTVSDDDGGSDSYTGTVTVANLSPVFSLVTVPATGSEGVAVALSAAATDVAADTVTYSWDFGDGTPGGVGASLNHIWADDGTYTVTVTASDEDGGSTASTHSILIQNSAPVLTATTFPSGNEGASLTFSATATDSGGDPLTFIWSFGDGSPVASGDTVTHVYADDGTYVASVTVSDPAGGTDTATENVAVANVAPAFSSVSVPSSGSEGSPAALSSAATDVPADTVSYSWTFGDGTPAAIGPAVIHTWTSDGSYTIVVTASDEDGGSTTSTHTVVIANVAPVISVASIPSGNEGQSLSFISAATDAGGDALTFSWNFGDGSPAGIGASTTHTYNDNGAFSVVLTVTDTAGATDTYTGTANILNVSPVIGDVFVPSTGNEGVPVALSAEATDVSGDPLTYTWTFGDGTPSVSGDAVNHIWAGDGTYIVTLVVLDGDGGSDTSSHAITIANLAPVITSSTISSGTEGVALSYAVSATDSGGDVLTYSWTFGDGSSPATGTSPSHTYADNGAYTVTVTVTDTAGATDTATGTSTVDNVAPAFTSVTVPSTANEGVPTPLSAAATDVAADTITYTWDFGDSTPTVTGASVSHTWTGDGTYTVTVTASDEDGGSTASTHTVSVANVIPVITSTTVPSGDEGESLAFSVTATDSGGDPLTYSWDFGDGTPLGVGASLNHTYADNGSYTVTVTVSDDGGGTITDTDTSVIANVAPTVTSLIGATIGDEGIPVSWSATFTDPGSADTHTTQWDFGDGSPVSLGTMAATHTYADDGSYTVTWTVTDDDGGTASQSQTVVVANVAPAFTLVNIPSSVDEGDAAAMTVGATDVAADTITYSWDFGDGSPPVTGAWAFYTYALDGTYTITVTASDEDGGVSTDTGVITVGNLPPELTAVSVPSGDEGESLSFSASAVDPGGDPLIYSWDFGDGSAPQTGFLVTHSYTDNGSYTVEVTVSDGDGGSDSDTGTATIANVAPNIGSLAGDVSGDEGEVLSWTAAYTDPGSDDTHVVSWDFGDGSPSAVGDTGSHAYADNGLYNVSVTVTDDDGGVATQSMAVTVSNVDPVIVSMTVPGGDEGASLPFSGVATDAGSADTHTFTWDFGDGSAPATGESVAYTYSDDGTYTITLTVEDDDGGQVTQTTTCAVVNVAPTMVSMLGPGTGLEGQALPFEAAASDVGVADLVDLTYTWDFGDGLDPEVGDVVEHAFPDDGTYTVTVTVDDLDGGTVSDTVEVVISNVEPEIVSTAPEYASEDVEYTYDPIVDDPGDEVFTWSLSPSSPPAMTIDSSTGHISWTPTYDDNLVGSFAVTLTVDDGDGGSDVQTWVIAVGFDDDDGDGMADEWETENGLDPTDPTDAEGDLDGDGISNLDEFLAGTDPAAFDGPSTPVLSSPIGGEEVETAVPWLLVENASDPQLEELLYGYEVYEDEGLSVLLEEGLAVAEDPSGETSWKVPTPLVENSVVWWRARASDASSSSPWSEPETFFVNEFNEAPPAPVAVYPEEGQTVATEAIALDWLLVVDPDGDEVVYGVEVWGIDSDELVASAEELSFDAEDTNGSWEIDVLLEEDLWYRWTVTATDEHGLSSEEDDGVAFLYTLENEAPAGVLFISPEDGSSIEEVSPVLVVQEGSDPEGGTLTYYLEVDGVETFDSEHRVETTLPGSETGTVEWSLEDEGVVLATDQWSYARVVAVDEGGIESAPDTIHFFVRGAEDAPPVPELLSPEDGSETSVLLPTFIAGAVEDPEGDPVFYDFVVASDAELTEVLAGGEGLGVLAGSEVEGFEDAAVWTVDVALMGEVFWSARAVDGTGAASDWAPAFRLIVSTGEPSVEEILEELLDGATDPASGCDCGSSLVADGGVSRLEAVGAMLFLLLPAVRRRRRR